ncbi:MAG: 3-dehydroquinate synthase [Pseudomonadota bacterium]|jgi:3-dehydroquinate synthase
MNATMPPLPQPLQIRSAMGDYKVEFWKDLTSALEPIRSGKSVFIVIDRNVERLYRPVLEQVTQQWPTMLLDADENTKTLEGVANLATWLQENGAHKKSTLVAIGGGIIQDICAFTSHIYYRGIDWIFYPSTLLSMCDSCIGAKCGINHNQFKNQVGVFHAPRQVHIVPEFLRTLERKDVRSGYGEILKLVLTEKSSDFDLLERTLESEDVLGPSLPSLIHRSLEIKKGVIEADEFESDLRRILNYGHTFGHSLETLSAYEVPHGLAVAWGIDLVNFIALKKGMISESFATRVRTLIRKHLSFEMNYVPQASTLIDGTKKDKKAERGLVNLILLCESPFGLKIVPQNYGPELSQWVEEYLKTPHAFARN